MNANWKRLHGKLALLGVFALLLGATILPVHTPVADAQSGTIIPPSSPLSATYGKSYADWSAAWWQWALAIRVHEPPNPSQFYHPLFETTGRQCGVAQSGPVWFLGGVFTQTGAPLAGAVTRNCTVPSQVALFFPIVNSECSALEGAAFGCPGASADDLRNDVKSVIDLVTNLRVDVDGTSLHSNDLQRTYRVGSPAFSFFIPEDNLLNAIGEGPFHAGNYSPAVSDGFYVMVAPLSVGQHRIHFHGAIPKFHFTLDVTYNLNVTP